MSMQNFKSSGSGEETNLEMRLETLKILSGDCGIKLTTQLQMSDDSHKVPKWLDWCGQSI